MWASLSSKRQIGMVRTSTFLVGSVRLADGEGAIETAGHLAVVAVAVFVVFGGDVSDEGVFAVRPPEAGAVVGIEGQRLIFHLRAAEGADGEVAVEDVVDLGAVFEEEAVADGAEADAVADDHVLGAVDRDPAVVGIDDGDADDAAAAHGVVD